MRLLADIKALWPPGKLHVFTRDLLEGLRMLEGSPWAQEIQLTDRKLARMLRPFGIDSATVRIDHQTGKGYKLEDFEPAFSRYLLGGNVTTVTPRVNAGCNAVSHPVTRGVVTHHKTESHPHKHGTVTDVTLTSTGPS